MKYDQLMHFLETARQEHVGKAAKILRISPSGITYSIECLERDLGVNLFEKRGKRIFLTEAGRRLLTKIPEVQQSMANLRSHVSAESPVFDGHYRIGATHLVAEHFVAAQVAELFGPHSQLTVEIFSLRSAEVLRQVLDEQLDLGVCFSPQKHPRLEMKTLRTGQIKIYVRPKHPLLRESKPLAKLQDYPAILPKAFGGIDVCESHEMFAKHGIKPNLRFAFDNYGVGQNLVLQTDGWGFFVDWLEAVPHFPLKPIKLPKTWQAPYSISAVWLKEKFQEPGISHFVESLGGAVNDTDLKRKGTSPSQR